MKPFQPLHTQLRSVGEAFKNKLYLKLMCAQPWLFSCWHRVHVVQRIVGSDIAELLLRGSRSIGACDADDEQSDVGSLIDLNETPKSETESFSSSDLLTGNPLSNEETSEQNIQNYTKLLLAGRKKVMCLAKSFYGGFSSVLSGLVCVIIQCVIRKSGKGLICLPLFIAFLFNINEAM